VSQYNEAPL